jgi:hypothetical protein
MTSNNRRNVSGLFSQDAEQSVIGGLMLDNDCWDEVAPVSIPMILFQGSPGHLS